MGGGSWDSSVYTSTKTARYLAGVSDFDYTRTASSVHENLDARRIRNKINHVLESRDSVDHPNSLAFMICLDVTGSNKERAIDAQANLPKLMELLLQYVDDPQISISANDDTMVSGHNAFQMSEFESDIRIDERLRELYLVGHGGSNDIESYQLVLYAAAHKTATDCLELRGKKGYLFMYCDEGFPPTATKQEIKMVFGDDVEGDIPTEALIEQAREKWDIYIISPHDSYIPRARQQYVDLFGTDHVLTLQQPNLICELIASKVGMLEKQLSSRQVTDDLIKVGTDERLAAALATAAASTSTGGAASAGGRAARL